MLAVWMICSSSSRPIDVRSSGYSPPNPANRTISTYSSRLRLTGRLVGVRLAATRSSRLGTSPLLRRHRGVLPAGPGRRDHPAERHPEHQHDLPGREPEQVEEPDDQHHQQPAKINRSGLLFDPFDGDTLE